MSRRQLALFDHIFEEAFQAVQDNKYIDSVDDVSLQEKYAIGGFQPGTFNNVKAEVEALCAILPAFHVAANTANNPNLLETLKTDALEYLSEQIDNFNGRQNFDREESPLSVLCNTNSTSFSSTENYDAVVEFAKSVTGKKPDKFTAAHLIHLLQFPSGLKGFRPDVFWANGVDVVVDATRKRLQTDSLLVQMNSVQYTPRTFVDRVLKLDYKQLLSANGALQRDVAHIAEVAAIANPVAALPQWVATMLDNRLVDRLPFQAMAVVKSSDLLKRKLRNTKWMERMATSTIFTPDDPSDFAKRLDERKKALDERRKEDSNSNQAALWFHVYAAIDSNNKETKYKFLKNLRNALRRRMFFSNVETNEERTLFFIEWLECLFALRVDVCIQGINVVGGDKDDGAYLQKAMRLHYKLTHESMDIDIIASPSDYESALGALDDKRLIYDQDEVVDLIDAVNYASGWTSGWPPILINELLAKPAGADPGLSFLFEQSFDFKFVRSNPSIQKNLAKLRRLMVLESKSKRQRVGAALGDAMAALTLECPC